LAGLAPDTFAPFSVSSWSVWNFMDQCLEWPAPVNFTPVIPAGTTMPDVPTLILGGDEDNGVPIGLSHALLALFPKASFVTIAGAGHPTMSMDGDCVPSIVGSFLETATVGDTSCAGTPG
jgi:pimeloyl-ACP methyl ester carboxylesterase